MGLQWGVNFFIPMVALSLGVMLPAMTEELDMTPVQGGLLGSAMFIGGAILSLPLSVFLSRYSPKRVTCIALFCTGLMTFIQAASPSFTILLIARFVFVSTIVSRGLAEILLIQQWFTGKRVALVISLTIGIFSIGQVAAVGLTPLLMDLLSGWRNVYYALGSILILGAFLCLFFSRDANKSYVDEQDTKIRKPPLDILRKRKDLWVLSACPAGAALAWSAVMTFWPTYALDTLSMPLNAVGTIMAMFPLGGIMGSFLAGPLSNRIHNRRIFIWLPGISLPVIYLALFTTDSPTLSALLLLVAGWNAMIWAPIIRTIPFDMNLSPREIAVVIGLGMTCIPIGGASGPIIVGLVSQLTGSLQVGLLTVVIFPLTLFVGGLIIPETSPKN